MQNAPCPAAANDDALPRVQPVTVWDRQTWTLNLTARVDLTEVLREIDRRE